MAESLPPATLIATNTAGSVPYFSGLRTIDMLGLNDATIAHSSNDEMGTRMHGHERANGAYVFWRNPDVVQFGSARGRRKPMFHSDRELFEHPGFTERYRARSFRLPSGGKLVLWVRKGWQGAPAGRESPG
jgi:hypothetical protein